MSAAWQLGPAVSSRVKLDEARSQDRMRIVSRAKFFESRQVVALGLVTC